MLCAKVAVSAALLACLPSVSPLHADALDEFLLARDALAGRSYAEAVVLLARFREEHPQSALSSEAAILRARAYRLWGKRDDAVKSLVDFIDNDPEDPWATRARLLLAEVFLEAARFEDASEIYRLRLEALRGDAYLLGLSSYYLEIADPAFVGRRVQDPSSALPKEIVQHDFATALEFYRKARAIHIPAGRRGEVSFRIARCLLELRQDAESVARSKSQTPPPKLAGTLEGDAIFSLATGLYRTGDPKGAIAEFLRLEKEHADHRWVPEALERVGKIRLEIVDATSAETERRVRFREALLTWNRFLTRYPQHDLAPRVEFQRAAALARFGDVDAAVKAYSEFPVRYEKDSQAPLAILRVAELERARNAFDAAIEAWKRFLGTYPNDSRWSTAQTRIKQARYDKGAHLLSVEKKPADARVVWGRFLDEYPLDSLAPEVYRRFYEMALPANAMPPDRGPAVTDETLRRQYLQAISHLRTLFGKYPRSPQAPSSRLITAQLIHHRLDDLEGSIIEYEAVVESFPGTLEARQAAETLTSLRRRHLKITTPRAFTTDGPWRLEIETRNVARLRFKAYRLNLEEYFRHKHAVASIEDVVVGVVEPTKTWESDLAGYRPFRLLGGLRELPLDDKELGAFIVTIEDIPPVTKIDAGPAEPTRISGPPLIATTLLLRSNIAFVTKHSTSGTLTWVFDERSGAPVRDARVLLSTSGGVVAEGKTDDEGIWRHDRTEASSVGDARIMAIVEAHGDERGSHYAVDRVVARGASAYGYSTKVHVSTDRPLYRPSQTVHFRAVLRKAVEGRYESSEGEKATILVRNPLGVVLFEETLTANEFGSIAGKLELTEEPPLGDYRVNVRYRKLDFAGSFAVEEYRKPEFAVRLATDRASYLPGEAIEGSIVTEYLFGAPVVGAQVSYSVFEGPFEFDRSRFEEFRWFFQKREVEDRSIEDFTFIARGSGKTDARGRTPFRIEARDAGAGRTYRVVVEATDLSKITVGGGGSVIVSPQGVLVVARADRKVYRPGDKATVSFRTVDATAAPIDASGDLVLLRRRRGTKGASLDEEVRSQPFETRNGLGETSLTIDKPGEYRVLFRTEDRAGTVCEGGAILLVAGDEPRPRPAQGGAPSGRQGRLSPGRRGDAIPQHPGRRTPRAVDLRGRRRHRLPRHQGRGKEPRDRRADEERVLAEHPRRHRPSRGQQALRGERRDHRPAVPQRLRHALQQRPRAGRGGRARGDGDRPGWLARGGRAVSRGRRPLDFRALAGRHRGDQAVLLRPATPPRRVDRIVLLVRLCGGHAGGRGGGPRGVLRPSEGQGKRDRPESRQGPHPSREAGQRRASHGEERDRSGWRSRGRLPRSTRRGSRQEVHVETRLELRGRKDRERSTRSEPRPEPFRNGCREERSGPRRALQQSLRRARRDLLQHS